MQNFQITNIKCSACIKQIEQNLSKFDKNATVNFATHNLSIDINKEQIQDVKEALNKIGYPVNDKQKNAQSNLKTIFTTTTLALVLFIITMTNMLSPYLLTDILQINKHPLLNISIQIVLTVVIMVFSVDIYKNGFRNLISSYPNMYSLISLGTSFAFTYSIYSSYNIFLGDMTYIESLYFETVAMILAIVLIGAYIEEKMRKKTSKALEELLNLRPKKALFLLGDIEIKTPVEKLKINDIIVVKAGMSIPVDGVVIDGCSSVDESMITGESIGVLKNIGDRVISSSINKNGILKIKVTALDKDNTINQIINIVKQAQSKKEKMTKIADIFSKYFIWTIISISIIAFLIWYFLIGSSFSFAFHILISILIIACPCAIGIATPISIMVALSHATKKHILIKNVQSLELMSKIDIIALDKTGTITNGTPELIDTKIISKQDIDIAAISSSLADKSMHPLSQAIKQDVKLFDVKDFIEKDGMGISGTINDSKYFLGNQKLFDEKQIKINKDIEEKIGTSHILFGDKKGILAIFYVKDEIKESSKEAIKNIQKRGIGVYIISGDNKQITHDIANRVGVKKEYVFSKTLPQEKSELIKKLSNKNKKVAFVGDGINDSIALNTADVSFAIGAGSNIAIESSDIVLTRNSLSDVITAIDIGKHTTANIKQNLFFAIGYNFIGALIASGVLFPFINILLSPMVGALTMTMSSISVLANALRLKFKLSHAK